MDKPEPISVSAKMAQEAGRDASVPEIKKPEYTKSIKDAFDLMKKGEYMPQEITVKIELTDDIKSYLDKFLVVMGITAVASPPQSKPAAQVQASGDDEECPKCGSKMKWITKPRKDGKKDKAGNILTWSAWSCPNTHPSIDISERCTQELIFPDKR